MFFDESHARLAEQLRAAAPVIAAVEAPGAYGDEAARHWAAARALSETGLFELVVPDGMAGAVVEHLYRAIRPLRIYEGTSEIQRTIIGRALAKQVER
jgi:hypothetical protein